MRTGGMVGEELVIDWRTPGHVSRLRRLLGGLSCTLALAERFDTGGGALREKTGTSASSHPSSPPPVVLFATDLNPLRRFVADGYLGPGLVAAHFTVHHVQFSERQAAVDVENTFAEVLLLAGARCVLVSNSRFGVLAAALSGALSGRLCWLSLGHCAGERV